MASRYRFSIQDHADDRPRDGSGVGLAALLSLALWGAIASAGLLVPRLVGWLA
jgi:hypothetical protein